MFPFSLDWDKRFSDFPKTRELWVVGVGSESSICLLLLPRPSDVS